MTKVTRSRDLHRPSSNIKKHIKPQPLRGVVNTASASLLQMSKPHSLMSNDLLAWLSEHDRQPFYRDRSNYSGYTSTDSRAKPCDLRPVMQSSICLAKASDHQTIRQEEMNIDLAQVGAFAREKSRSNDTPLSDYTQGLIEILAHLEEILRSAEVVLTRLSSLLDTTAHSANGTVLHV